TVINRSVPGREPGMLLDDPGMKRALLLAPVVGLLTGCGSGGAGSAAPTPHPTAQTTSNHYVAAAALSACRVEVSLVEVAEETALAGTGHYLPLRRLVPTYLHRLPAYVGGWDATTSTPVIGGGTSTKVAPPGCE
ncbi:MAG TPA: hypothetical protein VN088_08295, partial [Nocardioides sp.]|nr:hypothetical protein [Nocardioides sp.]